MCGIEKGNPIAIGGIDLIFSWYIVWYLFLAGTAAGSYVVAAGFSAYDALSRSRGSEETAVRAQVGFLAAPAVIAFAALFLVIDLGSPERAWMVFLAPFESIVATGAWLVALFFVLSAVVAVCGLTVRSIPAWFLWFAWIGGGLLACGVMVYTGLLLSDMVSIDFWNTGLLPVLFIVSSLATGLGLVLGLGALSSKGVQRRPSPLWRAAGIVGVVELIAIAALFVDRCGAADAARASCERLLSGDLAGFFWIGVIGCGIVVPFAMHALYRNAHSEAFVFASSAGVLVGGFFVRFCIVSAAVYSSLAMSGFA